MSESEADTLHPRIRERRAEVEVASLRTRNRKLIAVGIVLLLGLLGAAATQSVLFDVDEVRVIGTERTDPEYFRTVAQVALGTPILGLDTDAVEDRLLALPEVQEVAVDASWRGVVTVEVKERLPVARIETVDGTVLVGGDAMVVEVIAPAIADAGPDPDDASGDSSENSSESSADESIDGAGAAETEAEPTLAPAVAALPEISGAMFSIDAGEQVPEVLNNALAVASDLPADVSVITERVEITVDSLVLRVVGGGAISLGDARELDEKFEAVRAFLSQVDLRCLDTLNVAAPSVPVIVRSC